MGGQKAPAENLDYLDNNIFTRFSNPKFMPKYMMAARYAKYACSGLGFCICMHALLSPLPNEEDQLDRDAELVAAVTKQRFKDVREAMLLERATMEYRTGKQWGMDSAAQERE